MAIEIEIPSQLHMIVGWTLLALSCLAALWLVLFVIQGFHRKAYNLTKAEASGGAIRPDFLSVDQSKRDEAQARGRAFDEAMARRSEPQEAKGNSSVASACRLAKIAATAAAILSFMTAAAGAFLKIEAWQGVYNQLTSWERLVTILGAYKIGFAIAAATIIISLLQLVLSLRARSA